MNFIKLFCWYVKGIEGIGIIYDWDLSGEIVKLIVFVKMFELMLIKVG